MKTLRGKVIYSRLLRLLTTRVLNISKHGESTSLDNSFSTIFRNIYFLIFKQMLLYVSLCLLPVILFISITEKIVQSSLFTPSEIHMQWWDLLLFSPGWTVSSFSTSSCVTNALIPSLSLWPCARLAMVSPYLCCRWEPMNLHSTPNVPYQSWAQMGRITSFDLLAMFCLKQGFFLDEEYWKGADWVRFFFFLIYTFKVRKKWKAAKWIIFLACRFSQGICSLKYSMVSRYYGSFME